jgi:hypothetical protein
MALQDRGYAELRVRPRNRQSGRRWRIADVLSLEWGWARCSGMTRPGFPAAARTRVMSDVGEAEPHADLEVGAAFAEQPEHLELAVGNAGVGAESFAADW